MYEACHIQSNLHSVLALLSPLYMQILTSLSTVTKQAGYLISGSREASEKTDNPVAKKHFADSSKKVLAETESVVKGVRDQVKPGGK